jgi:hypothetical protein
MSFDEEEFDALFDNKDSIILFTRDQISKFNYNLEHISSVILKVYSRIDWKVVCLPSVNTLLFYDSYGHDDTLLSILDTKTMTLYKE